MPKTVLDNGKTYKWKYCIRLITDNTIKTYCSKRKKYKKIGKHEIWYIWNKTLVISTFCGMCGNSNNKIFKQKESIKKLKILSLADNVNEECI